MDNIEAINNISLSLLLCVIATTLFIAEAAVIDIVVFKKRDTKVSGPAIIVSLIINTVLVAIVTSIIRYV